MTIRRHEHQIGSAMREIRGVRDTVEGEIRGAFANDDHATALPPASNDAAAPSAPELPESRTFE